MSHDLDRELDRLEGKLPPRIAGFVRWVRRPGTGWVRWPIAIVLIAGGLVSFLPILGLWMIPLGLALIAQDVPFLQSPLARLMAWINDRWGQKSEAARAEQQSTPTEGRPR
jgi:hypothetical protein